MEASNDGVLGGFGHVSETDIRDSEAFLNGIISEVLPNAANGQRHLVALGMQSSLFLSGCVCWFCSEVSNELCRNKLSLD